MRDARRGHVVAVCVREFRVCRPTSPSLLPPRLLFDALLDTEIHPTGNFVGHIFSTGNIKSLQVRTLWPSAPDFTLTMTSNSHPGISKQAATPKRCFADLGFT